MAAEARLARHGPLETLAKPRGAVFSTLLPESRFSFRGAPEAARLAGEAFGVQLPVAPHRAIEQEDRAALWLGPDEWLVLGPEIAGAETASAIESSLSGVAHSLVDIGHRDVSIGVAGPDCEVVLNGGCPLDLDVAAFPVGQCTRTVFGKAGVLVWRRDLMRFRLDVGRSFAAYVWRLLDEIGREYRSLEGLKAR